MKINKNNPLQGRWRVECQIITDDKGWQTYRKFYSGECIWEFATESSFIYADPDERVFHGRLTEHFGAQSTVAQYGYLQNLGRLYVERHDRNNNACLQLHYKDIFRVEKTAGGFVLYELRDDNDTSDDHLCRLIMRNP